jgi:hypothetical protein
MKVKERLWNEEDETMPLCPPSKPAFIGVTEGTHIATCYLLADLGMQDSGQYGVKHQIHLLFEVPGERVEFTDDNGQQREMPRTIGKTYNFTLTEKATLRKDMESWRGRAFAETELMDAAGNPIFDITSVVGKPCQLGVIKNENGKSKIGTIMGLPKGFPQPPIEHELTIIDSAYTGDYSHVPKWIKDKLNTPPEPPVNQDIPFDDDVPF